MGITKGLLDSTTVYEAIRARDHLGSKLVTSLPYDRPRPAPQVNKPVSPYEPWRQDFIAGLETLNLEIRLLNSLARFTRHITKNYEQGDEYMCQWEIGCREVAFALFAQDGEPLSFDVWILIVHDRQEILRQVRNIGKKSAAAFFKAVNDYLAGNVSERKTPIYSFSHERAKAIYKQHIGGKTYSAIAKELGISAVRVGRLGHLGKMLVEKEATDGLHTTANAG